MIICFKDQIRSDFCLIMNVSNPNSFRLVSQGLSGTPTHFQSDADREISTSICDVFTETRSFWATANHTDLLFVSWLQLKTQQGTELLIQSDNDATVNDWFRALQDAIGTHVRSHALTFTYNHIQHRPFVVREKSFQLLFDKYKEKCQRNISCLIG